MVAVDNTDRFARKGDLLGIRGIIGLIGVLLALAGAITAWAALPHDTTAGHYLTALLLILAVVNLIGYIFGWPLLFVFSAACFWAAAPSLIDTADKSRILIQNNGNTATTRATLAGLIILFIGSFMTFFAVPSKRARLGLRRDIVALVIIAVFCIIGGAILAHLTQVGPSAQVFIVLSLFIIAIAFGSKSLLYACLVLSTILFVGLLPQAFPNATTDHTHRAGHIMAWLGMLFMFVWCIYHIQIVRGEVDSYDDNPDPKQVNKRESVQKQPEPAA